MVIIIPTELGWYREMNLVPYGTRFFVFFNEPFRQGTNVKWDEMRG